MSPSGSAEDYSLALGNGFDFHTAVVKISATHQRLWASLILVILFPNPLFFLTGCLAKAG